MGDISTGSKIPLLGGLASIDAEERRLGSGGVCRDRKLSKLDSQMANCNDK